ncbi:MAG: winged helix-turn-helix domain-containing protein [Deltaproteobacteria bacterium]|nr:winged helix-turn-helix domain-containing protein [Deltaproteobacteria bacterium]
MIDAEPGISNSELARRTGMSRPWVIWPALLRHPMW